MKAWEFGDADGGESDTNWAKPSLSDAFTCPPPNVTHVARRAVQQAARVAVQAAVEIAGPTAKVMILASTATLAEGYTFSLAAMTDAPLERVSLDVWLFYLSVGCFTMNWSLSSLQEIRKLWRR